MLGIAAETAQVEQYPLLGKSLPERHRQRILEHLVAQSSYDFYDSHDFCFLLLMNAFR